MAKTEQILRLTYIENFLKARKEKGASFLEIKEYLEKKFQEKDILGRLKFTERTFMRDKKAIMDISGIEISYSKKTGSYIISSKELEPTEENIYENMLLVEAYRDIKDRLDIMSFEKKKQRGLSNLNSLVSAITEQKLITFHYHKFYEKEYSKRIVEPYALKEFKYRWYLLAKEHQQDGKNSPIKIFGLDRISDLEIKSKRFKRLDFDTDKLFENSFGIITPNGMEVEEVILEFDYQQGNYIRTLPLHSSQKIISENNDKIIISLNIVPTYDFEREILSYGSRVKIIQPESLKKRIKNELEKMLEDL